MPLFCVALFIPVLGGPLRCQEEPAGRSFRFLFRTGQGAFAQSLARQGLEILGRGRSGLGCQARTMLTTSTLLWPGSTLQKLKGVNDVEVSKANSC